MRNLFSPSLRVTFGLLSLAVTLLLFMDLVLGVFPNQEKLTYQTRQKLAESVSVQLATMLMQDDLRHIPAVVNELVKRSPDLRSVGIRLSSGQLVASSSEHFSSWTTANSEEVGRTRFIVPIAPGTANGPKGARWGQIEFVFKPVDGLAWTQILQSPAVHLVALFGLSAGIMYYIYLRRTFQHLDPSSAVPERVQMAFDALSDAVLVLDREGRIVMANDTFVRFLSERNPVLIGKLPESFSWLELAGEEDNAIQPWQTCMRDKAPVKDQAFKAHTDEGIRHLICNCSPVVDARDMVRGCMVSFTDVTELDEANRQLVLLMTELTHSREELQVRNLELQRLASSDPMTGALNRRAFFPILEQHFTGSQQRMMPLSFVMCDIDKFKSINDVYGHPVGDKVIQKFASIILRSVGDNDVVCRYGGEEFCIALPNTSVDEALQFAERVRETVEAEVGFTLQLEGRPFITASFGVSGLSLAPESPAQLIEQADQALYYSKHNGRNQCAVFRPELAGLEEAEKAAATDEQRTPGQPSERQVALKAHLQKGVARLEAQTETGH
ncbi:diguanylate cyclase [Viridibacterium curvum]|uniref:diguanylate cyclase n=1 Tax=Viridibacterium curvum TaxID=1101404 RepID=A0ABP9Q7S4_9RHOO